MSIKKHIPNTITAMNLVCGVLGIIFAFDGRFDLAFYCMLGGSVFDFCDGLAARALNVVSSIGKELDSLSDLTTFGLLPSFMMYKYMDMARGGDWLCYIPLLVAVFSALRLAKFNVDTRQSVGFIGLATPANALLCASLIDFVYNSPDSFISVWTAGPVFLPVMAVVLCGLLVCEIPMFSFKLHPGQPQAVRINRIVFLIAMVVCIIFVAAMRLRFSMIAVLSVIVYILLNLIALAKTRSPIPNPDRYGETNRARRTGK